MIQKFFQRIIDFLRGKRSHDDRYGPGVDRGMADHAEATAVDRVRKATHPGLKGFWGKLKHRLIQGVKLEGGYPVLANGVGGYYNMTRRTVHVVTVNGIIKIEVWIHECGHDLEYMLGLIPPWHYKEWIKLFLWWRNVPPAAVPGDHPAMYRLPGCEEGDVVEIDFADGRHMLCQVVGHEMREMVA